MMLRPHAGSSGATSAFPIPRPLARGIPPDPTRFPLLIPTGVHRVQDQSIDPFGPCRGEDRARHPAGPHAEERSPLGPGRIEHHPKVVGQDLQRR
jgi:hypothetical protein